MVTLDETDMAILRQLATDGRRAYSAIADEVGLSGPAVSDRVSRLEDAGIIRSFTVEIDRSQLTAGVPVFVQLDGPLEDHDSVIDTISDEEAIEHVFTTAEGDVWFSARAAGRNVRTWLSTLLEEVESPPYSLTLLDEVQWTPSLHGTEFALTCDECGNSVDSEGESTRLGDRVYHFCCPSCASRFSERYESLEGDR
ncbi:MAG: AsnC family transcriptional regulator [Natrialbaceae archaeon]|nr:AsnC family transcriptional regulator [Natrialbaceae archaeon]